MKLRIKRIVFFVDNEAMLGLPMRLTVSVVIGAIVLISVLSMLFHPGIFPQRMVVAVTPIVTILTTDAPENVSFLVHVSDGKSHSLMGASVIIKGLGSAGSGFSDEEGNVVIHLQVTLRPGVYEGYLDISVTAPNYVPFEHQQMVKIVKRTS